MQPSIDLKRVASDLVSMSSKLLELLGEAARESARSPDERLRRDGPDWATEAAQNITQYRNKLDGALRERDPRGLSYAAGEFAVLARYVNDYDYSWFSGHRELNDLVGTVHKTAASIVSSINTFDEENLEKARRSLL
ncbi:MAG TPA: hypothetical protein VKB88_11510 [Bryobacteraceae bacterium]|nr:hypothetical protein [Bryobacteraceae bacterium]